MGVQRISAEEAIARLGAFDAIIDTRSEGEYALDHIPGACNWPSLHDAERARVGTRYEQVSPFEARKLGAALVARNAAHHIETHVLDKPRHWTPLLYCWRGGQRSAALAHILGQIGFPVHVVQGGYKAFRKALVADLRHQVTRLRFRVLCGPTGSGKTRLLHALAAAGAQVLDLEGIARHRASVLGLIPDAPQPTQKHFETGIWDALRTFDAGRTVFAEAESKKVGNLMVPEPLIGALRASPCARVELPQSERVALLLEDYPYFVDDVGFFCDRLEILTALRGKALVRRWQELARAGDLPTVVTELLEKHYDPGYATSTRRNFRQFPQAEPVRLATRAPAELRRAAAALLRVEREQPARVSEAATGA